MPPLSRRFGAAAAAQRACAEADRLAAAGEPAAAEAAYRQALELAPDHAAAWNNLGNILMLDGRCVAAAACYDAALTHGLIHPLAFYNRGTARRRTGDRDGAAADFARALALQPDYAEAWNNLANLRRYDMQRAAAARGYLRALRLKPAWEEAHDNLSAALYLLAENGEEGAALTLAAEWRRDHPDHPTARHLGAALAGEPGDPRASDDYVRQVFDCFADNFENQLTELGYQAPALLADALARAGIGGPGAGLDVLDAGCGTGWCGPLLRAGARRLDGVDLSPGMLAHAATRSVYDALHAAELTAFLRDRPHSYDLIVAADVFCYFGALAEAFAAAAAALRPGGALAFTVERWAAPLDGRGWLLQAHGRYAHDDAAVRAELAAAGFMLTTAEIATLRHESGQPISGMVMVAVRAG